MNNILALGLLGVSTYTDWKFFKIYNKHVMLGFLAGLLFHLYTGGLVGLKAALMASAAGLILLLPAWMVGALGGGDVKLFAALGAIMGLPFLIKMTFWVAVYSVIGAVPLLIYKGKLQKSLKWTWSYLKYLLFKITVFGLKEKEEPVIENGTPIKFAFIITLAAMTTMIERMI